MKKILFIIAFLFIIIGCGNNNNSLNTTKNFNNQDINYISNEYRVYNPNYDKLNKIKIIFDNNITKSKYLKYKNENNKMLNIAIKYINKINKDYNLYYNFQILFYSGVNKYKVGYISDKDKYPSIHINLNSFKVYYNNTYYYNLYLYKNKFIKTFIHEYTHLIFLLSNNHRSAKVNTNINEFVAIFNEIYYYKKIDVKDVYINKIDVYNNVYSYQKIRYIINTFIIDDNYLKNKVKENVMDYILYDNNEDSLKKILNNLFNRTL